MNHAFAWVAAGCGLVAVSGCDTASVEPIDGGNFGGHTGATSGGDDGAGVSGRSGGSAGALSEGGSGDATGGSAGSGGATGSSAGVSGDGPGASEAGSSGSDGTAGSGGAAGAGGDSREGGSDVVGTVVDAEGAAAASTKVEIDGELVTTDATGAFTVHHIPDTYRAVIVFVPPPHGFGAQVHTVEVYDELTTRSPHFRLQDAEIPSHNGGVSGSLSGGTGFPVPQGHNLALMTSHSDQQPAVGSGAYIPPASYDLSVMLWASEIARKHTFGALEWSAGPDGLPTGYDGWASQDVMPPLNAHASQDLALVPVEARTVTGTIGKPTDCVLKMLGTVGTGISLFTDTPTTDTFSYLMPKALSGATITLTAKCSWADNPNVTSSASVGLDAANSVNFTVPAPPRLTLPSDQAPGVTYATPFSWSPGDNLLSTIAFHAGEWTILRHGTSSSTTLPDLTRFGVTIAPSAAVSWSVSSIKFDAGSATTWDDATGWHWAKTGHSLFAATSEYRTSTFAP